MSWQLKDLGRARLRGAGFLCERRRASGARNVQDPAVRQFGGGDELGIGLVRDVDKPDVVVLAVVAARGGLIEPLEPVRSDEGGMGGALLT